MSQKQMPKIIKQWIAALKSGDYLQGKECLKSLDEHDEYRYCCLGVLTDLIDRYHQSLDGIYKDEYENKDYLSKEILQKNRFATK